MSDEADVESAIQIAWKETEKLLASDPTRSIADPTLPIYREAARLSLENERQRFEAGDRMALLGAIRVCANHDLSLPRWASEAFIKAYDTVLNCRAASWDEVFGKPYPGKHLEKLRRRRMLRVDVRLEIARRLNETPVPAIDKGLFESVGGKFGIGATQCSELYYGGRGNRNRRRRNSANSE